jgi:hypothetical protein
LCEKDRFLPKIATTYENDTPSPLVSIRNPTISRPPRSYIPPTYQSGDPGGFISAYYRARGFESDGVLGRPISSLPTLTDSDETIWKNRSHELRRT